MNNEILPIDLPDSGSLEVNVYAGSIAHPVDNARITVTDGDSTFVVDSLSTDSSGSSETIELAAPPFEYSQEYGFEKPYSEYNLSVEADGFETINIRGVQILSGATAIQNVELGPAGPGESETVYIEQNTLWGMFPPKIPEAEVKPLPEAGGFVVLPEPVIPSSIVVHLGAPSNASARNVTVGFRDYIKNVASCEIYATWPRETLKANIIAIISLTLNRVYTEWYRSRGYNFTITNSTAYDQAFSPDRNIYESISDVVDEVFSTYITRPNIEQPLFAQYCDGRRVPNCIGLKQWGSKDLGDRGLSAIQILRNYYGSSVYYETAEIVQGVPSSYGGSPLTVGSSGAAVRTLQSQLNAVANNYPAIPKVAVDGVYGPGTAAAVRAFQRIFDLTPDGVVGFATWYRLSYIYTAVRRLAEPSTN